MSSTRNQLDSRHQVTDISIVQPILTWWYRISAPAELPSHASFTEREIVRRGRVGSLMILGTIIAIIIMFILVIATPHLFLLIWTIPCMIFSMLLCLITIPLNHRGNLPYTALLLLSAIYISFIGIVLSESRGLDPLFLSLFDLLATTELLAVSLLAPSSVFLVALFNALLIVLDVNFQTHSMMWSQMISSQEILISLLIRPLILYLIVALVSYTWLTSALRALQRADRAEEIARLEQQVREQKQLLENGIQDLLNTHIRVANGDLAARASTDRENVLWQLSTALNNLLSRYQYGIKAEGTLNQIANELNLIRQGLQSYMRYPNAAWIPQGITLLSPLVHDLSHLLTTSSTIQHVQQPGKTPSISQSGISQSGISQSGISQVPFPQPHPKTRPPLSSQSFWQQHDSQ